MKYSDRIAAAFALAHELHEAQFRKGSEIPYIAHLLAVAALVGEFGGDEDQFIAALLHDAVEDQGGHKTLERIRDEFGARVAGIVDECTDAYVEPKPRWRERKERHIQETLAASDDARLVLAADKLHNARTMAVDIKQEGERLWERFTASRDETLWYYRQMLAALGENWSNPILDELEEAIETLEQRAG